MSQRALPAGFIAPCLPTKTDRLPSGSEWLYEIKHDGFQVIARKKSAQVRLYSRPGNDLTYRFPLIVEALAKLPSRSCLIDGEAVACNGDGMPVFDRLRYRRDDSRVFLYAFDLIELDGKDLRREPIERRKVVLIRLLAKASVGLQVNEHIAEPGDVVFRHACQLGFEGIVSKRLGSLYSSGI
jgi:bifunctional non-homologous end joining protein LigD